MKGELQCPSSMMELVWSWTVVTGLLVKLLASRVGVCAPPRCMNHYNAGVTVCGSVLRVGKRMRVVHGERCPRQGPALFVGNHIKLDDPCLMFIAAYRETRHAVCMRAMMRDDFFADLPAFTRKWKFDEAIELWGALPISRGNVRYSQLKPFLQILEGGGSFLMYIGRTRTRTGTLFEYRDDVTEPGSAGFFVAHAQRRRSETPIPVVPMVRTFNPVDRCSAVVFGEPMYLSPGADRDVQRAFDLDLVARMGDGVEVNVPQVLSALLYLRCAHGKPPVADAEDLCGRVGTVFDQITERLVDPAARIDLAGEFRHALRYFAKKGAIRTVGPSVECNPALILSCPAPDRRYKRQNPVKYLANQILHLTGVTRLIERAALDETGVAAGQARVR